MEVLAKGTEKLCAMKP